MEGVACREHTYCCWRLCLVVYLGGQRAPGNEGIGTTAISPISRAGMAAKLAWPHRRWRWQPSGRHDLEFGVVVKVHCRRQACHSETRGFRKSTCNDARGSAGLQPVYVYSVRGIPTRS